MSSDTTTACNDGVWMRGVGTWIWKYNTQTHPRTDDHQSLHEIVFFPGVLFGAFVPSLWSMNMQQWILWHSDRHLYARACAIHAFGTALQRQISWSSSPRVSSIKAKSVKSGQIDPTLTLQDPLSIATKSKGAAMFHWGFVSNWVLHSLVEQLAAMGSTLFVFLAFLAGRTCRSKDSFCGTHERRLWIIPTTVDICNVPRSNREVGKPHPRVAKMGLPFPSLHTERVKLRLLPMIVFAHSPLHAW